MKYKCPKCGEELELTQEQLEATGYQAVCPQVYLAPED